MDSPKTTKNIIFDGDDTLWDIAKHYEEAIQEFIALTEIIIPQYRLKIEEIRKRFDEIDIKNIETHGFSAERFPLSMVETLVTLYNETVPEVQRNQTYVDYFSMKAHKIGYSVFSVIPKTRGGVKSVLATLKMKGYNIYLLTCGEKFIQMSKVRNLGLERYFNDIWVVNDKTEQTYRDIIELKPEFVLGDKNHFWMVGNSFRHDIVPAYRAGIKNVIHIGNPNEWAFYKDDYIGQVQYYECKDIINVLGIIDG